MKSTLSITEHVALSQNRWLTALLAEFSGRQGARYVELLNRLGMPRDSLSRTLDAAIANGWLARNAGYGHPLRPEYVITDEGQRMAKGAHAIRRAQENLGLKPSSLTRWGMPLIYVVWSGEERFGQIASALKTATPRALSQGLQVLETNELLSRAIVDGRPPFSRYKLTSNGVSLAEAA